MEKVDYCINWITSIDAQQLCKENVIVYYASITGSDTDAKWHSLSLDEAKRVITYTIHPVEIVDIMQALQEENRVYVTAFGEGKGLYRSDDAGLSWSKLRTDKYMRGVTVAPQNSNIIYVTSFSSDKVYILNSLDYSFIDSLQAGGQGPQGVIAVEPVN